MPTVTYSTLRQQVDQTDSLKLGISDGLVPSGSVTNPPSASIESRPINFPMDDFSYESGLIGKKSDLNKLLSLTDGDGIKKNNYAGSQALINSDRVIVNSRLDYLMLFGESGVAISSPGNVNIDAEDGVTLYGEDGLYLGVPGKGIGLDEGGGNKKTPKNKAEPTLDNDYEPVVLGLKLANLIEDLLITIKNATILTPTGKAYFREDTMYELACLQARLPEMLSTFAFVDGISHEPTDPAPEPPTTLSEPSSLVTGTTSGATVGANSTTQPGSATSVITSPLQDRPDYFETNNPYD